MVKFLDFTRSGYAQIGIFRGAVYAAVLTLAGCGSNVTNQIDAAATACPTGSASIEVGDGFYRILCGCTGSTEQAGTVFASSGGLTCHLATSSDRVFFHYLSTTLQHQILSTGTTRFVTTFSPQLKRVDVVSLLDPATTYPFMDAYSGLTGSLITP